MRTWPALDLEWARPDDSATADLLAAHLDDLEPLALEEREGGLRAYFRTTETRARATAVLAERLPDVICRPVDVPDEGWAERSQASIGPVVVGRVVVAPPWTASASLPSGTTVIRIQPSMGFGTGHHASTRLCLTLLQRQPVHERAVLDVGTGSGILALVAWRLGASRVVGIDADADALASAAADLVLNDAADQIALVQADLSAAGPTLPGAPYDLVLANLTAAVLERHAARLVALARPSGTIIASGFERADATAVASAFGPYGWSPVDSLEEAGWVGVALAATSPTPSTGR